MKVLVYVPNKPGVLQGTARRVPKSISASRRTAVKLVDVLHMFPSMLKKSSIQCECLNDRTSITIGELLDKQSTLLPPAAIEWFKNAIVVAADQDAEVQDLGIADEITKDNMKPLKEVKDAADEDDAELHLTIRGVPVDLAEGLLAALNDCVRAFQLLHPPKR